MRRLYFLVTLVVAACASRRPAQDRTTFTNWHVAEDATETFRSPGDVDLIADASLGRLIEVAAERNPRLAAARSRWLAASERPAQARGLPDPLFSYTEMVSPVETRVGPQQRQIQLSQRVPYPGRLAAAGQIAAEEAIIRGLEYEIALRDVIAEVKVSYVELLYLRKARKIVEQNQSLARLLAEKSAALYAGGREEGTDAVTLFDTLKAQAQLAQLAYDTITLEELSRTEEAQLNSLLSRAPEAEIGDPGDLAFRPLHASRAMLYQLALDRRQELEAATRKIAVASEAERLARLGRVPDFTFGATYTFVGSAVNPIADSGDDAVGVMVGVSIPLWGSKNRARIAEAEHRLDAARLDRQTEVNDLMARITRISYRLDNAERLVRLYTESLIPQAESAMEVAEQWRDTGRDTMGRLLEAQSVWLNFQLAHHRALADYEQAVARMEQLVGTSLGNLRGREAEASEASEPGDNKPGENKKERGDAPD